MAGINGRDVKVAYARSNTWGTAASVTTQMNLRTLEGFDAKPGIVTDESFNQTFIGEGEIGDYAPTNVELAMDLRYQGAGPVLIAAAMGSAAAPAVVSSVAANSLVAYAHVLTLATDLTKFFTVAADFGGSGAGTHYVLEVPTLKPRGFTLSVGDNGKMQISVPATGAKTIYNSAVNTNSTVNGAAAEALSNRVFRRQGVYRLNLQSAGSLTTATDAQNVSQVNLTYQRPLAEDQVFGQNYIIEPDDDGWAEFTGELVFPRMTSANANSLVVAWPNGTHLKMDLTFSGAYINSTTTYGLLMQMPAVQITEWTTPVTGHNLLRPTAKFALRKAMTAPTGMTGITDPLKITFTNMNSLNLLT